MRIDFENGSTIEGLNTVEESKRSRIKNITLYPITLDYLIENNCPNCVNWTGESHNYDCKGCERCMDNIKVSQQVFAR